MHLKISAPNIHLFAFQIRARSNGETEGASVETSPLWQLGDRLLEKLQSTHVEFPNTAESELHPIEAIARAPERRQSVPFSGQLPFEGKMLAIAGSFYPLQIRDSYALAVNIGSSQLQVNGQNNGQNNGQTSEQNGQTSGQTSEQKNGQTSKSAPVASNGRQKLPLQDVALLGRLNPDRSLLLEKSSTFLGQTLLVTVWLTAEQQQQGRQFLKQLADSCLESLFADPENCPEYNGDGQLFGSPIFEYGNLSNLPAYRHVLVWFFCHEATEQKFKRYYRDFIDLFYYRNKAIRAYQLSRATYRSIYQNYQQIERYVRQIFLFHGFQERGELGDSELQAFKLKLQAMPKMALEYSSQLRDLEYYGHTIASNGENYAERLRHIKNDLASDSRYNLDADLSFLEQFNRQGSPVFAEQIRADLTYFEHGNSLLDKAIAAIRGIVAIEQTQSERQLYSLIQSQSEAEQKQQQELQKTLQDNRAQNILVLGIGLFVGAIAARTTGLDLLAIAAVAIGAAALWFLRRRKR